MRRQFFILLILCAFLASCGKYEEGPLFSLRSKEQRVANQWEVAKAEIQGMDLTPEFNDLRYTFDRHGNAEANVYVNPDNSVELKGNWSFEEDKSVLRVTVEGDSMGTAVEWDLKYEILRLKESEMRLRDRGTGVEITFEPF